MNPISHCTWIEEWGLVKTKALTRRTTCMNNIRQLGLAMGMYLADYNDFFPAANSSSEFTPEEWMLWDPRWPGVPGPQRSLISNALTTGIVPYVVRFNANLFACPADLTLSQFRKKPGFFSGPWYPFSYTLNSPRQAIGNSLRSRGMASIQAFVPDRTSSTLIPFNAGRITTPATKIMFVDELMIYETDNPNGSPGDTSGWEWPLDRTTRRHNGRASVTFADGHVETVEPRLSKEAAHYDPLY